MCEPACIGAAVVGAAVFGDAGRAADADAGASPRDFGSGVFSIAGAGTAVGSVVGTGVGLANGSPPVRANSCCSGVFFQRQANCERPSPVIPSVRTNAHNAQATRMAATSATRLGPSARRRLTTAQATRARQRPGMT